MVEMRKRTLLIALAAIALGLIGTGLSTLYTQKEYFGEPPTVTVKESYGFPLGWQGYSWKVIGIPIFLPVPTSKVYWLSLGPLLLDAAFWIAISSIGYLAIIKSMNMVHKARASKDLSVINI